jgi:membrane protease YdiL (CAAX protease family)
VRYSPNLTTIPGGARIEDIIPELLLALALVSTPAAVWVFADARRRLRPLPATAWALGTLVLLGVVGAAYVLTRPSKASTWGLGEVLAVLLFFVMAIPLLGVVLAFTYPHLSYFPFGAIVLFALFQNAAFVAVALYIVLVKYHLPLSSLGLGRGSWVRYLELGIAAAAAAVLGNLVGQNVTVFALALAMGRERAGEFVTREEIRAPIYRILPHVHQGLELLVLVVLIGVIVPIGEEIFFRGLTYGALRRMLRRPLAVVLSALFFAGVHFQPVEILPILILGVILAWLYEYTGSLVPGMIAHGMNNLAALVIFYHTPPPP